MPGLERHHGLLRAVVVLAGGGARRQVLDRDQLALHRGDAGARHDHGPGWSASRRCPACCRWLCVHEAPSPEPTDEPHGRDEGELVGRADDLGDARRDLGRVLAREELRRQRDRRDAAADLQVERASCPSGSSCAGRASCARRRSGRPAAGGWSSSTPPSADRPACSVALARRHAALAADEEDARRCGPTCRPAARRRSATSASSSGRTVPAAFACACVRMPRATRNAAASLRAECRRMPTSRLSARMRERRQHARDAVDLGLQAGIRVGRRLAQRHEAVRWRAGEGALRIAQHHEAQPLDLGIGRERVDALRGARPDRVVPLVDRLDLEAAEQRAVVARQHDQAVGPQQVLLVRRVDDAPRVAPQGVQVREVEAS